MILLDFQSHCLDNLIGRCFKLSIYESISTPKDLQNYDRKIISKFKVNTSGKDAEEDKTKKEQVYEQKILTLCAMLQLPSGSPIPGPNPSPEHSMEEYK